MPNEVKRPMRRGQKPKDGDLRCVKCFLEDHPCHFGTLRGRCGSCGLKSKGDPLLDFEGFFNKGNVVEHMLSLARSAEDTLISLEGNILKIKLSNSAGSPEFQVSLTESELLMVNIDFQTPLDQFVWQSCIPKIRCEAEETGLISSALLARGYLALLFPSIVTEEVGGSFNGICFCRLILARLHRSIAVIVDGFRKASVEGDGRYWAEAACSLAILHQSLVPAQKGLENSTIKPVFGGIELARLLAARIKSTLTHLTVLLQHPSLNCDPNWASILDGSLHDLQSDVKAGCLTLTTTGQVPVSSTMSLSGSLGSPSSGTTDTRLSSVEANHPDDQGTLSFGLSIGIGDSNHLAYPTMIPTMDSHAAPWNQLQNLAPPSFYRPPADIGWGQVMFSPPSDFPYGTEIHMSNSPHFSTIYTSQGDWYGDFILPESTTTSHGLEASFDVFSGIEQDPDHVSLPLSNSDDWGDETSVLDSRALFPDLHYDTLLDDEELR